MNPITALFHRIIGRTQRQALAEETDATFLLGTRTAQDERDRLPHDREEGLRMALEAWRVNPLARRVVSLTTQYVVGGGLRLRADSSASHDFLQGWWRHRLNQLSMRVYEWCDELTRSGELFLLISTDAAGMSYVRAVPAGQIKDVRAAENDLQQEVGYAQAADGYFDEGRVWPAYDEHADDRAPDGSFPPVMLHYAVNRPVGALHGESDLVPLLRWLARYASWLEDRARLNRFRNAFMYVVKSRYASEQERYARQQALTAAPPGPGSILVTDESETWDVIHPKLDSHEAGEDGLAIKKMVAAGAGLPLHFLAEPESSTRATAESAGGPTYRHFEQRQEFFCWLIADLARAVLRRRAMVDPTVNPEAGIQVTGADLSARDNSQLAQALQAATAALGSLRDRGVIDDAELLRMAYRFAGEVVDVDALLERARHEQE